MTRAVEVVSSADHGRPTEQMDYTIRRSTSCPDCGAEMLWTQNAWHVDSETRAAYRCLNGHVVDPSMTRQCPACGVHDTTLMVVTEEQQEFRCSRCGQVFGFPRCTERVSPEGRREDLSYG